MAYAGVGSGLFFDHMFSAGVASGLFFGRCVSVGVAGDLLLEVCLADLRRTPGDLCVFGRETFSHLRRFVGPAPRRRRCLQVTLMSQTHLLLILCSFFGVAIVAAEICLRKYVLAAVVSMALVVLVHFLCRIGDIDQYAALAREVHQLKRAADAVALHKEELCCRRLWRGQQ